MGQTPDTWSYGDVDAGFRNAALVLDETFVTPDVSHQTLETRSAMVVLQSRKLGREEMSTLASMRAPVSKARRHARFPVRRHRPTRAAASAGATLHHCRLEDSPSLHRLSRRGGSSLLQRSLSARRPPDGGSLHTGFSKRVFGSVYASGILTSKLRTIYKNKEKLNRAGCNLPEDGGNRSRGGACGDCGLVRTGGES